MFTKGGPPTLTVDRLRSRRVWTREGAEISKDESVTNSGKSENFRSQSVVKLIIMDFHYAVA